MSEELYFMAGLTKEQREEIELLEMKACIALLDDQIVQLHRVRDLHSGLEQPGHREEYDAMMASVAHSTSLARQLNARATLTLSERAVRMPVRLN